MTVKDHAVARTARVVGAALALCTLGAGPAHASLAGGSALATQTRPDLRTVALATGPNASSRRLRFCFDAVLRSDAVQPTGFAVGGYDAAERTASIDAVLDLDDTHCVIAVFPSGTDIAAATVGFVVDAAVRGQFAGKAVLGDAAPLADSRQETDPGRTDAPDLVAATPDVSFGEIVYRFDRKVGDPGPAASYVYYDAAGNRQVGVDVALDLDDRRLVRVTFAADPTRSVRDATRAAVEHATVTAAGAPAKRGPETAVAVDGQDGRTARPDLVSASKSSANSVDFVFDAPVEVGDATRFALYRGQATRLLGEQATVLASRGNVVRVWFGIPAERFFEQFVLATVDDGGAAAVHGSDLGALVNTIGSAPVGAIPNGRGFTSAPDATALAFDLDEGAAIVSFDQPIDDTTAFDPAAFRLVDRNGNELPGQPSAVVDAWGSQVKLLYGSGLEHAAAVQLLPGAVRTFAGDLSVLQVIGRGAPPAPPPLASPGAPSHAIGAAPGPVAAVEEAVPPAGSPASVGSSAPRGAAVRLVLARMRASGRGRYVLSVRLAGEPGSVRVRIRVLDRHGRTTGVLVRRLPTNRLASVRGIRAPQGGRLRIAVAP